MPRYAKWESRTDVIFEFKDINDQGYLSNKTVGKMILQFTKLTSQPAVSTILSIVETAN